MGLQAICRKGGIPMRVLLLVLVVLTWTPAVASAQANLCDPNWLERASGAEVRALLRGGADVNQICNDNSNRPLPQALLRDGVSLGVIRALGEAGADILAANIDGTSPLDYTERRFVRAERQFPSGRVQYRRKDTLYLGGNSRLESGGAAADAHSQLCDLDWWRSSASRPAVEALLRTPGVDPNTVCNLSNDRPIHLPLKLTSFTILPEGVERGIEALVDGNADLRTRNNSGRSAVSLAEIRWDRVRDRIVRQQVSWCRGAASAQQLADEAVRNINDTDAYVYVRAGARGQPLEQVTDRAWMELYGITGRRITKEVLCPYRGITNYR